MNRCAVVGVLIGFVVLSSAPAWRQSINISRQVAAVRSSVVHVERSDGMQGSGCVISGDGIVFTARHITDANDVSYVVTTDDGRQFSAKYVIEDRDNDVGYLKLDLPAGTRLDHARLSSYDDLRAGQGVFIFGSPLGKDNINTVSVGIISATNRDLTQRGQEESTRYGWRIMVQSTSPAFPGNSGGPVFDMRGRVIGVQVAGQAETLNFSVPVSCFRGTLSSVRQWFELCRIRVKCPDMRGPQGPQGLPGPQGPPGSQGPMAPMPDPNGGEDK